MITEKPLKEILRDREIYNVFHTEFQKNTWLNLTGLQSSEACILDLYRDDTVPREVLDAIVARLSALGK